MVNQSEAPLAGPSTWLELPLVAPETVEELKFIGGEPEELSLFVDELHRRSQRTMRESLKVLPRHPVGSPESRNALRKLQSCANTIGAMRLSAMLQLFEERGGFHPADAKRCEDTFDESIAELQLALAI